MNPIMNLPATCELCGNWLPGHSTSCARYGVHPSQWCLGIDDVIDQQETVMLKAHVNLYDMDLYIFKIESDKKEETENAKLSL